MKPPAVLAVSLMAAAACGGGDDSGASVSDTWARATSATVGAVYFDLEVTDDDTLVGAAVPADIAARAEIHESVPAEMSGDLDAIDDMDIDGMNEMDMGAMRMQQMTDGLPLTGGETVSFEPGAYHVMLPDLVGPLVIGDEFELTLDFATADEVTVSVEVAETSP